MVGEGLTQIKEDLAEIQRAVLSIEGPLAEVDEALESTDAAFELLESAVGESLDPLIEEATGVASSILETVKANNHGLELIKTLPLLDASALAPSLGQIVTLLDSIRVNVQDLQQSLRAIKADDRAEPKEALQATNTQMSDSIGQVLGLIDTEQNQIQQAGVELNAVKSEVASGVDIVSMLITLLMVWLGLAQAFLMTWAVKTIRTSPR